MAILTITNKAGNVVITTTPLTFSNSTITFSNDNITMAQFEYTE